MTALYIISFLLLVVATIALLKLTPEQINKDINELFNKQQTLKDQALTARGKKKKNRILLELERMRRALQETGKEKQFSIACAAALLLMVAGCVVAIAIDNMFLILELEPETRGTDSINKINTVEFRDVDFEYEAGCPVLKGFNLKIKSGEKIGIVGHSGNGKTTVTSLLLGFYQVNNGVILINDIPFENIDQKQLRKMIGVVSQDVMIFEDTIRYNLNLGNDYSDEEIYTALEAVKLLDVVNMLPNRIDTVISSASHNLSGGQKQRLMIARMLLRKPAFITLDEATSSLDVETEKIIIQMLNEKMMDATVIVISHRFETIRHCQRIVVLNNHTVEAIGAHESLMEDSATYKALYGR